MKSFFFLSLVSLCTSCATYQYATISSSLKNEDSNAFEIENDTVKISYDFTGEQGPVKISIYNKLNTPLYVDWSRSALIVGDVRTTYYNKNATITADMTTSGSRGSMLSRTSSLEGRIITDQAISFIPPKSWAKEHQRNLSSQPFNLPATYPKQNERRNGLIVASFKYDPENTPFNFRSFLTISTHQDLSSPSYFDHSFWVSEIIQTMISPHTFSPKGDQFYIKKGLIANP